jgi:hypothetical protein
MRKHCVAISRQIGIDGGLKLTGGSLLYWAKAAAAVATVAALAVPGAEALRLLTFGANFLFLVLSSMDG